MHDRLTRIAGSVEQRLRTIFNAQMKTPQPRLFTALPDMPIIAHARDLTLRGGKRLRPAILVGGYELFKNDGLQDSTVSDVGAAIELLQSYLLIHDDIMDGDDTRRGGLSVHRALEDALGDARLGSSLAILAGDLMCQLADRVMLSLDCDAMLRNRVHGIFCDMTAEVIAGQCLDMLQTVSPEEIVLRKTASYTTVGPLCLGAALAGASDDQLVQLLEMARPMGVAFQWKDDLMGMFGDVALTGKPVGSDLRNGKRTALLELAKGRCSAAQLQLLDAAMGGADEAVTAALEIVEQCGARAECEQQMNAAMDRARAMLKSGEYQDAGVEFLLWIQDRIISRDR